MVSLKSAGTLDQGNQGYRNADGCQLSQGDTNPDFTYANDGLFVKIIPESTEAIKVWNEEIAPKTANTGKVLAVEFPTVKSQLIKAGFTIRKAAKVKESDSDLLRELGL